MRTLNQETITQAVIARLKDRMTSLVQHLHAFVREARPTELQGQMGLEGPGLCCLDSDFVLQQRLM